jgi:hypothetical protein
MQEVLPIGRISDFARQQSAHLLTAGKVPAIQRFASGFVALSCLFQQLDFIRIRHDWLFHLGMRRHAGATL